MKSFPKVSMGTTLLAIECTDGVVMASDSRTSSGSFIASRATNKLTEIASNIYCARCGAAADTQALSRYAKYYLGALAINSETPMERSVQVCANTLKKIIQANKERLSAGLIVGGFDSAGPQVYAVDLSGLCIRRKIATNGSGSTYIQGFIDSNYKEDFTVEEATQFAIRAVNHAIIRDGSSGGVVNVVQITKDGSKRITVRPAEQPMDSDIIKS